MNQSLLVYLTTLMILAACQRATEKATKPTPSPLRTHKEAADTLQIEQASTGASKPLQMQAFSTDEQQQLLAEHDLSALWLADVNEGEATVYNGFYGPDHYRIEMYFASVEQDEARPNIFHLTGKSRYKKNITPFSGTITIDSIVAFRDPNLNADAIQEMGFRNQYTATGQFNLREDATIQGSGVFAGKVIIDFGVRQEGELALWYYSPTKGQGAGFVFDGQWQSYRTGKTKPVMWAEDLFMIADNILDNFSIGERDVEINPKYRHLGWDNYWSNDEWWNDTPVQL